MKEHGGYYHGYCNGCDRKKSIKDGYCDQCRPARDAQLNEIADNLASGNFVSALEGYINKSRAERKIIEKLQEHVYGRDQRIAELEAANARLREALKATMPGPEQTDYLKQHGLGTDAIGVRATMEVALHALESNS